MTNITEKNLKQAREFLPSPKYVAKLSRDGEWAELEVAGDGAGESWAWGTDDVYSEEQVLAAIALALSTKTEVSDSQDLVNPSDCETGPEGEWYCENHPDQLQGHGGCDGVGIPACARLSLAMNWLRFERQKVRELHHQYGFLAQKLDELKRPIDSMGAELSRNSHE